ncbi:hypothetical protein [Paraburkholderia sp. BL10I2N1]|nr:hypothetical protein [Paraburkholderia sp. BL10I2N1]
MSAPLQEQVLDGRLNLAILPEPELPASVARVPLGRASFDVREARQRFS